MDYTNIILAAYQEEANWARHYDTIRIGITALAVTLSGISATAVWTLVGKSATQNMVCGAMIIVGLLLSGLSVQYNADYRSSQRAERKMQGLVIDYESENKTSFCQIKIWKKQVQAYSEVLGISIPKAVSDLGCKTADGEAVKWPKSYPREPTYWHKLRAAIGSAWIWLNVVFGVFVPLVLLKVRPRPT